MQEQRDSIAGDEKKKELKTKAEKSALVKALLAAQ